MAAVQRGAGQQGILRFEPNLEAGGGPGDAPDFAQLGALAKALGFAKIGVCGPAPLHQAGQALDRWLSRSFGADMAYLQRPDRTAPESLLPGVRSILVAAMPYPGRPQDDAPPAPASESPAERPFGSVARYAQGSDYHFVVRDQLRKLAGALSDLLRKPLRARICVDTAPLLERALAERAGLGFTGKNTMTILPEFGSYVLLGELLLDTELPTSSAIARGCGSCRACLDACPTGAFVDEFVLDARRCVSYLTIESQAPIPRELRAGVGQMVFGCDICQQVCPYNLSSKPRPGYAELNPRPHLRAPDLVKLLELTSSEYRRFVKGTALRRVSRASLQRNAAVALGNTRNPQMTMPLIRALSSAYPLVRQHVVWALAKIATVQAFEALRRQRETEDDEAVLAELDLELGNTRARQP